MLEDELLELVVGYARLNGWLVHHDRRSDKALQQGDAGFPDLVLVRDLVLFVELKRQTAKLDPAQVRWHDRITEAGGAWRLWRPADWPEIARTLRRPGR